MSAEEKRYDPILPNITDWPIYQLSSHRYEFIHEVTEASLAKCLEVIQDRATLIEELQRTLYQERIRLSEKPWKADPEDEKDYWGFVKSELFRISSLGDEPDQQKEVALELMRSIISRYSNEIAGNFDPEIYEFAKIAIPFGFSRLLKTSFGLRFKQRLSASFSIKDRFSFEGDIETIRELGKKHTLVILPTHSSNVDSAVIGWAIQDIGLPAFIYGAGLNLFGVKLVAYFINRLGAYKVDRRKKNMFYLETLYQHSTLALHKGVHSLFFPGGTRSRSGEIERKLKLGLLGTAMDAQYLNFLNAKEGEEAKKIIVIPVTLNYHFVLEAQSLINEHLKITGKELYIAERDELSTSLKILNFVRKFLTKSSKVSVHFAPCMDLFGNRVDANGVSYDKRGKELNIEQYFISQGQLKEDPQRNSEYVKLLGDIVEQKFLEYNVVFSSHLVAFVAFTLLRKRFKKQDIYSFLRTPKEDRLIPYQDFVEACERVRTAIFALNEQSKIKIAPHLKDDIQEVIAHGLRNIGIYHNKRVLLRNKQGDISTEDLKLLYFYHNRLEGYQLAQYV
ncbi:MAG: 1-acyl-sn-glycerol-3-phosphate acyltransferase [Chitinophagales bacterium]|nr:1-acyl-sn-glycerol-3-phosphate acyltransferase [Chitinophagales bacterium]